MNIGTEREWTEEEVKLLLEEMKSNHRKGVLSEISYRKHLLRKLKRTIKRYEKEIEEALHNDLGKSPTEAYVTEIGMIYSSINYMLKYLETFAKPKRVKKHLATILSDGYVYKEPYGVVLIISAFNYPFQLMVEPLIGAIAAGNLAVVKPSEQAIYTQEVLEKLIGEVFPRGIVRMVKGSKETVTSLTSSNFDYIFFTGSPRVGKAVMGNAAKHLTPVTLELGGKSPALVMKRANIKNAAKKIAYGKFTNAGQTCIAPDFVLVHKEIAENFIAELKKALLKFYGADPKTSKDYGRIINKKAFNRLHHMMENDRQYIVLGGDTDSNANYIAPTVLVHDNIEIASMQEEIFGPILPIIIYEDINMALATIRPLGKPLAFYVFTEDRVLAEKILKRVTFGGGCVNDVLFHVASPFLPFGGVGQSGMGNYHGEYSFKTFTHNKTVLKSTSALRMSINEPPIGTYKEWILRTILK